MVDIDTMYGGGYKAPEPPKNRRKVFLVFAALVVVAIIIIVTLLLHHKSSPLPTKPDQPSRHNQSSHPANSGSAGQNAPTSPTENAAFSNILENDDNPNGINYDVTSGTQPVKGWYVVHVTATNSYGSFHQIAILKQDSDGETDAIAGPDTSFPRSYLESENVPEAVINQVPIYNE